MNTSARLPQLPGHWTSLAHAFLYQAKTRPQAIAVVDSLGVTLTYKRLLVAAVALADELSTTLDDCACVGVVLPPSAGGAIANIALALLGKVTVNLNYSTGQALCNDAIDRCRIRHIISSKRFLKRVNLQFSQESWIDLDEMRDEIDWLERIKAWTEAEWLPDTILSSLLPGLAPYRKIAFPKTDAFPVIDQTLPIRRLEDPSNIIFTSGSTGKPKGVVLSHRNILSNIQAISMQGHIQTGEVVLGVVPFFHSFGLTMTLWAPLCLGETVVYHYNPLEAKRIADLCQQYKATSLFCTPTMMGSYLKRSPKEKFASLRVCILGGEKLKLQQRLDFEKTLGIKPYEGYGLAETSPVVSCNVPGELTTADGRVISATKCGTVGRAIPGTEISIRQENTDREQAPGESGMIYVKGPQVMMGYLHDSQATNKVLKDGWFKTGDIGFLDQDGFLTITGRTSQFSKIAGEMVSHLAVEDEIMKVTGITQQTLCVTSAADSVRGEKLIVVYSDLGMTPHQVIERLRASSVSRLFIPAEQDFIKVESLPMLGNGKLDLNGINAIVLSVHSKSKIAQP
jgi:acyl-[acyl-carrier-protein]-phospholipid O-acyltransferase / long-chain-fatty-acid--[acyl-carrier-protein] ligase